MLPISEERELKFAITDNRGQAVLLVFLLLAIGLTVVASVFLSSLRDYRSTHYTTQYSQAGSAAEAGLEAALADQGQLQAAFQNKVTADSGPVQLTPGAYQYNINPAGAGTEYVTAKAIEENEVLEVRLSDVEYGAAPNPTPTIVYNFGGSSLTIYWGSLSGSSPSIETRIYRVDYDNGKIILDREVSSCSGGGSVGGVNFNCSTSITIDGSRDGTLDEVVRIRPIGGGTKIGLRASADFAVAQAVEVVSEGSSGEARVKLEQEVTRSFLPPIFDFLMFSGGSISK